MEEMTLQQAELTAQEILKQAKAEAKRILKEAKAQLEQETASPAPRKATAPITQASDYEQVELELFADSGNYTEPLAVKWGGRQFLIPRGVRVRVPAPVAEIIRISDAQEYKAAALIRRLERAAQE